MADDDKPPEEPKGRIDRERAIGIITAILVVLSIGFYVFAFIAARS